MKKFMLVVALGLFAALLLPSSTFAQGVSYDSGFQVQNLSNTQATVVITYYNQDGTVETTVTDTVAANGSVTYFPIGATAPFDGSVVISSDQPVAAIANVIGDGQDGSSYGAFSEGAETVSLPLINKDNFGIDTWFNVQNAGAASVDVTVSYSDQPSCDENATIDPGAAATFDQATNTCLPSGYVGAATISAPGGSVVATVMQVSPGGLFAYNGFTSVSTNPVMPLTSSNNFGFQTGTQIQNTGGTDTDVTVTYTPTPGNGTACTETRTIPAGGSSTFTLYAFSLNPPTGVAPSTTDCVFGETFVGSMEVTGNSEGHGLVAIVNQTNFADKGSAYNGFDPAQATSTVVMPLIQDAFNIWTGFNVQNVGGSDTTVTCSYSDATAAQDDVATIGSGEAMNIVHLNAVANGELPDNLGSGRYVGSATCTASGGGLILGVVNQANSVASGDTTLTYEAIND